jgi:hypothetical protein
MGPGVGFTKLIGDPTEWRLISVRTLRDGNDLAQLYGPQAHMPKTIDFSTCPLMSG